MHDAGVTVLVAAVAFAGTMVDNFVAFVAQLSLTEKHRHARASVGQLAGVISLIVMSGAVGSMLSAIPLRWVGLLAAAPLALAVHAWRHQEPSARAVRRGAMTTFVLTIAFGGDNLAVWSPLLRADGYAKGLVAAAVFLVGDVALIVVARSLASHPRVVTTCQKLAPRATPLLYVGLSGLILWECRWF